METIVAGGQGSRSAPRRASAVRLLGSLVALSFVLGAARPAAAQSSADVNAANNPLTPKITVNFHDQMAPSLFDLDQGSNAFLLRGLIPLKLGGQGQLFRYTLPIVTAPDGGGGHVNGLGDLNLIDLFPFALKGARMEVAVGPQLSIPTGTDELTGTGKWQAGFAAMAIAPRAWGLGGTLVTWQHSFAGDDDRASQNNLSVQPLIIYNLPRAWYLRSTATWNFAFAQDAWVIPLGAGAGRVWVLKSGTSINAFAEPQFSVAHEGVGQPRFQIYMGVTLQFPLGGK